MFLMPRKEKQPFGCKLCAPSHMEPIQRKQWKGQPTASPNFQRQPQLDWKCVQSWRVWLLGKPGRGNIHFCKQGEEGVRLWGPSIVRECEGMGEDWNAPSTLADQNNKRRFRYNFSHGRTSLRFISRRET